MASMSEEKETPASGGLEWGTRDSRLQGKVPNSGCGESESQPKGDESLHCCHFCILSGMYLPRLAQMETESHPYQWPEIAKPSLPSPAPANTNCLCLLPPLPATNSRLYTHTALQTPPQGHPCNLEGLLPFLTSYWC